MIELNDKLVVVTGAARGIGFAIAEGFAKAKAKVVIIDLFEEAVNEAVKKFTDNGFDALGYAADVTNGDDIAKIFKTLVKEHKKIDVLVNNAGITKDGLMMRMKESDWDAVINVNLKGTFICTQKISRYMLSQKSGSIINIASVIGVMGNAGQTNYAASKGGIIALTKASAKEMASRGIRVNSISPGFIETEMTATLSEDVVKGYAEAIPLAKMGKPADIANACLFLASNMSAYITGQNILVDGGLIM